ncbi:MAG: hypothetical protein CVU40_16210 [Chloroflexi bacterium HGW-Chloroflexi-2]|nr:MAG: hypothetical protein CVU40_16210 [Chloroflexi bacterium HGW-Chloroflexi-2]
MVVDLGIILTNDFPLVGNSRVGGLEAIASVQFDQREVGAFSRTPVHRPNARTIPNARTPAERPYTSRTPVHQPNARTPAERPYTSRTPVRMTDVVRNPG